VTEVQQVTKIEVQQIIKMMKNRANGMVEEAKNRNRPGLKQAEEILHLIDMLEMRLDR
jgi:vacuolar-type H+-ATPase subunit H